MLGLEQYKPSFLRRLCKFSDDTNVKYSPRLIGRTSVTFENAMYIYGGESVEKTSSDYLNQMYKYTFDTTKDIVSLSLVEQKNACPNWSFCGVVMIEDHQMMILTQEYVDIKETSLLLAATIVCPYVFNFLTSTWNTTDSKPFYPVDNASVFRMRKKHTTVIHNNVIFTLGGIDYYSNSSATLNSSWYYDISANSYGVVNNNNFNYQSIAGCSFNLLYDLSNIVLHYFSLI